MRRCAFLGMDNPAGFVIDDDLAHAPFRARGWAVETVPWTRAGVDWGAYEAVVIRSTWDYPRDPEAFLAVLAAIEAAGTPLMNPLSLVRWNLRKTYLRDLHARGIAIVPTVWRDRLAPGDLAGLFAAVGGEEIIVKPVVGANAEGAFRLDRATAGRRADEVEAYYADRALLAQPLAHAILDEGEYSLFFFGGVLSHAIRKVPAAGDFRVQEEHGGDIQRIEAPDALRALGTATLAALPAPPLYARADFVRANDGGGFWLMELELIEPSMYLRMDPAAPARFAEAFVRRMAR